MNCFNLLTLSRQAPLDLPLLKKLLASVQKNYGPDNIPPHHRDEARSIDFEYGQSRIFVVNYKYFVTMSPFLIQRIHRQRHILVLDVEQGKKIQFNEDGLNILAPLDEPVQLQGI